MFTAWFEADFWPIATIRFRLGTEPCTIAEPALVAGLEAVIGATVTTIAVAATISIVEDITSSSSTTIIVTVVIEQLGDCCCC